VRHTVDPALVREARTFSLRFACDDCAHFDAERIRCVHGYTERPGVKDLEQSGDVVTFCKEFELA
jgi:hypothetical protein